MAEYYNMTAMEASRNLGEYLTAAGAVSNGMIFYMILIVVAVVIFIVMSQESGTVDVLIADGFIVTLVAALMWAGGFVSYWVVGPPLAMMLFGIAANHFKSR